MHRWRVYLLLALLLGGFLFVLRARTQPAPSDTPASKQAGVANPDLNEAQLPQAPAGGSTARGTPGSICGNCGGSPPASTFIVHSYQGRTRCLDYTPEVSGS